SYLVTLLKVPSHNHLIQGAYISSLHFTMSIPPLRSMLSIVHLDFMVKKYTFPIICTPIMLILGDLVEGPRSQPLNTRSLYIIFTLYNVNTSTPINAFHRSP